MIFVKLYDARKKKRFDAKIQYQLRENGNSPYFQHYKKCALIFVIGRNLHTPVSATVNNPFSQKMHSSED